MHKLDPGPSNSKHSNNTGKKDARALEHFRFSPEKGLHLIGNIGEKSSAGREMY